MEFDYSPVRIRATQIELDFVVVIAVLFFIFLHFFSRGRSPVGDVGGLEGEDA